MKKLLFIVSLWTVCTLNYAQEVNNELLKKLVAKEVLTQDEANELMQKESTENKDKISQTATKVREAFNTPYMKFSGYGMLMYKYNDLSSVKHSVEPRLVILSMDGELTKNLKYYIMGDFVKPTIYEYYLDWSPIEQLHIRLGQQKSPLSIENLMSLTVIESTLNTRSVSALIGGGDDVQKLQNGKSNTGRDIGLLMYGNLFKTDSHNLLEYNVGIYQGSGINTAETNNTKDLAINLMFRPIKSFRVGGGMYLGEAVYNKENESIASNHVRNRWIVSSDYNSDRFCARAEWMKANDGGIQKEGLYGMGLYYVAPKKLNIFAKVDYYNQNKGTNNEVIDYMIGANYYFYDRCRFQLNYTYSDYSKKWGAENSNIVIGQMQIVF